MIFWALLFAACYLLFAVRCLLFTACYVLLAVCYWLYDYVADDYEIFLCCLLLAVGAMRADEGHRIRKLPGGRRQMCAFSMYQVVVFDVIF